MQSLEKAIELSEEKKAIYIDRKEARCPGRVGRFQDLQILHLR